jgi:general secretion pathway protein L
MTIAANRPLKGARPRVRGPRVLAWWLGELRACRDDVGRAIATRGRRSFRIEAGERYWLLRQGERPIGQADAQSDGAAELLRLIPASERRRPVIVEIPPERTLAKTVILPAGAGGQIDRILGFEIARHFPFPAERVYFRHRVVDKGGGAVGVTIEIIAVPREIVDGICAALAAARLRPAAISISAGPGETPLFLPAATLGTAAREAAPTTRILAFATVLTALAALASWPLAQQAELGSLERDLAALKPHAEAALRAGETDRRASERSAAILALRAGRPPLVAMLDTLSRDLPDGSWLLSLSITGRDIVLDGLAPSAAAIALALEKSRDVSSIVFRSPITRETSGLEHFQLGASLGAPLGTLSGPSPGPSSAEAKP